MVSDLSTCQLNKVSISLLLTIGWAHKRTAIRDSRLACSRTIHVKLVIGKSWLIIPVVNNTINSMALIGSGKLANRCTNAQLGSNWNKTNHQNTAFFQPFFCLLISNIRSIHIGFRIKNTSNATDHTKKTIEHSVIESATQISVSPKFCSRILASSMRTTTFFILIIAPGITIMLYIFVITFYLANTRYFSVFKNPTRHMWPITTACKNTHTFIGNP